MSSMKCEIKLKNEDTKTFEKGSIENADISVVSKDIKLIQKEINDYLTTHVDKERELLHHNSRSKIYFSLFKQFS